MSANSLLILGAGGHGKVVADAAMSMKHWDEICFLDDKENSDYPYKIIGVLSSLPNWLSHFPQLVVAIGDNHRRAELLSQSKSLGYVLPAIIHSHTCVSSLATLGYGSVVFSNAVVNSGAIIREGCIINSAAIIEHDCVLQKFVHVSPNVALAGGVKIGEYSWIGIGSNVVECLTIGKNVIVGAGSVVINDIPDDCKVVGVPAKEVNKK